MNPNAWTPAGMSFLDRLNTPTECGCCGREGLKKTVKMSGPGGIVWMGTTCAAKAMNLGVAQFRTEARTADTAVADAERAERDAANNADEVAWEAYLLTHAGPGPRVEQIARLGGFGAARAAFRASLT